MLRTRTAIVVVVTAMFAAVGCSGTTAGHREGQGKRPVPARHPGGGMCQVSRGEALRVVDLSNGGGRQQAALKLTVGQGFAVVVSNGYAEVTAPVVTAGSGVLCEVGVSPPGRVRRATFTALSRGSAYVSATITGVPGGVNHPVYGVASPSGRRR